MEEETDRPNKKYELSNSDNIPINDEGIVFHYKRENRLANAPKEVQDLYKEQKPARFGLLGPLVADRPRKILFFSIIALCLLIFALSRMGFFDTKHILDGNRIEISGTRFEGNTIIRLRKTAQKADVYTGTVDIAVSVLAGPEEHFPVYNHRIFFTLEKEEEFRFAVPFDADEQLVFLNNERGTLIHIRFKPE